MTKKSAAILSLILITVLIAAAAYAADAKPQAQPQTNVTPKSAQPNPVAAFFRGILHWPFKTAGNVVNTAGNTVKDTGTILAKEGVTAGSVVTGQFGQTPKLVTEPVKGTAEMVGSTAKGVVTAPVDAAKEVKTEQKAQVAGTAAK